MNYGAVIINDFFNAHVFGGHKSGGSAIYLEMGDFKAMNELVKLQIAQLLYLDSSPPLKRHVTQPWNKQYFLARSHVFVPLRETTEVHQHIS